MARPKRNGVQRKFSVRNDLDEKLQEMARFYNLEYVVLITRAFEAGFDGVWQQYLDDVEHSEQAEVINDHLEFSRRALESNPSISGLIVLAMREEEMIIDLLPFHIDLPQETIVELIEGRKATDKELRSLTKFLNKPFEELRSLRDR